jgi:thiol-disulfide isomerase/thioredoxin
MIRRMPLLLMVGCAPHLYTEGGSVERWTAPENSWPSAAPPEELVGTGLSEGQIAVDIRGTDQHGDEVSLWQFWGLHVLVDISTMWCGPCQELGKGTEDVYQEFRDRGFIYLTVLHEDVDNGEVSAEELNQWAGLPALGSGEHDTITSPVIEDFQGKSGSIGAVQANQYPVALLIGPDMKVLERIEPVTEPRIVEVLEEAL